MWPRFLTQLGVVVRWNMASLWSRRRSAAMTMIGFAGVVAVFIAVLSIQSGFENASRATGGVGVAMVMHSGAQTEISSLLRRSDIHIIESAPGIVRTNKGPIVAPEVLVVVNVPKKGTMIEATVLLRGIHSNTLAVREGITLVQGRMFAPGLHEVIVGRGASGVFKGLGVGDTLRWGRHEWTIVGIFAANGSIHESEIWADGNVLRTAYDRGNTYQAVYARLESADAFAIFQQALETDSRLSVSVREEDDYYREQGKFQSEFIATTGTMIALLMAAGAVFGAMNMMDSTVATRRWEIGVLRAIGFDRWAVLWAVLIESILLALAGGAIGGLLTWLILNGYQVSTLSFESFNQIVFAFAVTQDLLLKGITLAILMGFIGGLPSALAAARAPIVADLRAR